MLSLSDEFYAPSLGGMYGNCYLIWGDLSSRYFPFICLFPAQYMMWLLTFSLIVIINTAMMVYSYVLR